MAACGKMVDAVAAMNPIIGTSHILDVGAGTGSIERAVRQRYPEVPILATDQAQGMVDFLRSQNISGVEVEQADATDLSTLVPAGHFTHAFGAFMIQLCGDRQPLVCSELFRALADGGCAALSICVDFGILEPFHLACEQLDGSYKRPEAFDEQAWKTVEPLMEAMRSAGFVDVTSFPMEVRISCKSPEEFVDFWWNSKHPILTKVTMSFNGDRAAIKALFRTLVMERFPDPSVLAAKVDIAVGRKPAGEA